MSFVYLRVGDYALTAPAVASLATALVVVAFGVWVVLREPEAHESIWFLLFCCTIATWLGCFAFMYAAPDAGSALRWMRPGYVGLALVPAAAYGMTSLVLGATPRRQRTLGALLVLGALTGGAVAGADLGIRGTTRYPWGWMHRLGPLGIAIAAFLVGGVGLTIAEYVLAARVEERGPRRARLVRILVAFSIGLLAALDFLPSLGIDVRPLGSLALLVGMGLLATVLSRHRFVELTPAYAAEAILRTMRDPLLVADSAGRIRMTNEALRTLVGGDAGALDGARSSDVLLGPDGSRSELPASGPKDALRREERMLVRADGTAIPVEATFTDLRGDHGQATGTLVIARDLRGQRAMERTVRATEERFSAVFRLSPLPISLSRLDDTTILEVNRAFERFSGWSREEVLGRPGTDLSPGPDGEALLDVRERVRAGEPVRGAELRLPTRTGGVREVLAFADRVTLGDEDAMLLVFSDITRRKQAERDLRRRALFDYLTGLPNRALFQNRLSHALEKARRSRGEVGVLFVDLDGFKEVNDNLGHAAGDHLLQVMADRLRQAVRDEDTVARLGGDEFAVLIEAPAGREEAAAVTRRIEEALREPARMAGHEVPVRASIGVAVSRAEGVSSDDLMRWSDLAMYRAKDVDGTAARFWEPEQDRDAAPTTPHRLERERALESALERDELELHFQPVFELSTGRIRAAEALLRWRRPGQGLVGPDGFLALAEETGLILPIGDWVLRESCGRAARWEREGLLPPDFRVIVNVSRREVEDPGLPDRIEAALMAADLPGARLQLDMPERVLLGARGVLDELRERGVRFSVDDFGSRHSAVGVLRSLRAEELKLAPGFVRQLTGEGRDAILLEAVLGVAGRLGVDVVAEGVETGETLQRLRELGCPLAQGFHLGRPEPAAAFEALLAGTAGRAG